MKIGLLSDSHSFIDDPLFDLFKDRDEIWHAGDFGSLQVIEEWQSLGKPFKGVYGNIDNVAIKNLFPLDLRFAINNFKVYITHIAGYPGRYTSRVKKNLMDTPVDLFICGHSHILKIMKDPILGHLHINPGAHGHEGFHSVRTVVRFEIKDNKLEKLEIIELGTRGRIKNGELKKVENG